MLWDENVLAWFDLYQLLGEYNGLTQIQLLDHKMIFLKFLVNIFYWHWEWGSCYVEARLNILT